MLTAIPQEAFTGMAAVLAAVGGLISVIAKKESSSVKQTADILSETIKRQQEEINELREQLQVERTKLSSIKRLES